MEFRNKKVENCFAQARTYEYEIPVTGRELLLLLEGFQVRENHRFRRPVFQQKKVRWSSKAFWELIGSKLIIRQKAGKRRRSRWKIG